MAKAETESRPKRTWTTAKPGDEGEEGMLPVRPNRPWTDLPDELRLQGLHHQASTRWSRRTELCDEDELDRLRAYLDSQLRACRASSPGSPTGCSAG